MRKILSRIFQTLPCSTFDVPVTKQNQNEIDEAPEVPNTSQFRILDIINHTLDDENRIAKTEMRDKNIDIAVMNRALQIYFSHSDTEVSEEITSCEEKLQADSQFLEDIGSLKDYPLPSVLRVHRELCGKKIITKRVAGSKKKVISNK